MSILMTICTITPRQVSANPSTETLVNLADYKYVINHNLDVCERTMVYIGSDGNIYATGSGGDGQLGNGSTENHFTDFVKVNLPTGEKAISLDANYGGTVITLTESNKVYVWGSNANLNNSSNAFSPIQLNLPEDTYVKVCGYGNSFCVLGSSGKLYVVGSKRFINGSTSASSSVTTLLLDNGDKIKDFTMGQNYVIALSENNELYSMGYNSRGQLGLGHKSNIFTNFNKIDLPTTEEIVYVGSDLCTSYFKTSSGKFYVCGNVQFSTLGLTDSTTFIELDNPPSAEAISIDGRSYLADGVIYATFGNDRIPTGNTSSEVISLTPCISDKKFVWYASSNWNVYGITEDGDIYAGGLNNDGELMTGNTEPVGKMIRLGVPVKSYVGAYTEVSNNLSFNFTQKDSLEITLSESEINFGSSHGVAVESGNLVAKVKSSIPYSVNLKGEDFLEQGVSDPHKISISNLSFKIEGSDDYTEIAQPTVDYNLVSNQLETSGESNSEREHVFKLKLNSLVGQKKGSYKTTLQITAVQD